ncbi:phage holin family protein [Cellulomonas endophytica]|uniref:phage holin family protein n=1 Tax=Cellulomonas endophytica TaxID=2494735 RepID=UPI00101380A4|nr:phage holin family protein [Cellulomonas endophytica]
MGSTPYTTGAAEGSQGGNASVGELLGEVTRDLSTLMRQEVALAKAEATESAKQAGKGAGMFAGAGVAGHFVLLFLSIALWWGLGDLFDSLTWSAVVVAVLWGIVAAVLALRGKKEMAQAKGLPRTQETAQKIPNALKGHEEKNA